MVTCMCSWKLEGTTYQYVHVFILKLDGNMFVLVEAGGYTTTIIKDK